jgi:hypothetical protein
MTTLPHGLDHPSMGTFPLAATLLLVVTLGACSAAGLPVSSPPTATPPVATSPADPGGPSDGAAAGSGQPGDTMPGGGDSFVLPKPGQLDVHPIAADGFIAQANGHHVVLTIAYTSGVEPCSILDTIAVERGPGSFAITLREGHGPGNQICIMIARLMKTQVDLGDLDPGTYTISDATGGAAAIQVVVS